MTALLDSFQQHALDLILQGHNVVIHGEAGAGWHALSVAMAYALPVSDLRRYWSMLDGEPTGVVELPVEWIRDDAVYFNMNRFAGLRPYTPPEGVFDIFRRELEAAAHEGGLFQLTMHPHMIGYRSRIWILDELIRLARSLGPVWFATHADVVRHVLK